MIKEALGSDGVEIFKLGDGSESEQDLFDEDYLARIDHELHTDVDIEKLVLTFLND